MHKFVHPGYLQNECLLFLCFFYPLRNDETIISSISVTDIVFDVYLKKWNYKAIPKVKTWSYFLIIPKSIIGIF